MASLETELKHSATKADMSEFKALIAEREVKRFRWLVGIMVVLFSILFRCNFKRLIQYFIIVVQGSNVRGRPPRLRAPAAIAKFAILSQPEKFKGVIHESPRRHHAHLSAWRRSG